MQRSIVFLGAAASALLALAGAAVGLRAASATTIYVSSAGSDNNNGLDPDAAKATLSGALGACPSAGQGTCSIKVLSGNYSLGSGLTISQSAIIECADGVTFSVGSGGTTAVTFEASNSGSIGCTYDGTGESGGQSQGLLLAGNTSTNPSHISLENNTFLNLTSSAIGVFQAEQVLISGNTINEVGSATTFAAINVAGSSACSGSSQFLTSYVAVSHNIVSVTGPSDGITVEAENSQCGPTDVAVTGNTIKSGRICVEEGNFSGGSAAYDPQRISVSGNSCEVTGSSAEMGLSVTAGNTAVTGNTIDLGQSSASVGIEAGAQTVTVSGNTINMGSATGSYPGCIVVDSAAAVSRTIAGNVCYNLSGTMSGVYVGQSIPGTAGNAVVTGNVISAGAASWTGHGVWFQCNNSSLTCDNLYEGGNMVLGNGGSGSAGIVWELDQGSMTNLSSGYNVVSGVTNPFLTSSGLTIGGAGSGGTTGS